MMSISVQCEQCTKRYRFGDEKAGKKFRCRECAAVIEIPTKRSGKRKAKSRGRSQRGLLFAGIGGGVVITAAIVWAIVAMTGKPNKPKADSDNEQLAQNAKSATPVQPPTQPRKSTPSKTKSSPVAIPKKSPPIVVDASTGKKPKKQDPPRKKQTFPKDAKGVLQSLQAVVNRLNSKNSRQDSGLVRDTTTAMNNAARLLAVKQPNDTAFIPVLFSIARFLNTRHVKSGRGYRPAVELISSANQPLPTIVRIWKRSASNDPALRKQVAESYRLLADQMKQRAGSNKTQLSNAIAYYREAVTILRPLSTNDRELKLLLQQTVAKLTAAEIARGGKSLSSAISPKTIVAPDKAMVRPLSKPLNLNDQPLFKALTQFAELSKTQIVIDQNALDEAGLTSGEVVQVKNQKTAGATLTGMLKKPELNWLIENGVVLVTTDAEYQDHLQTRIYQTLRVRGDFNALKRTLRTAVKDAEWLDNDGTGGMMMEVPPNAIAIQQTYHVLEELERKFRKDLKRAKQPPFSTKFTMTGMRHPTGMFKSDIALKASDTPLKDVIADFCKHAGVKFSFDQANIQDEGISLDKPVTMHLRKLRTEQILDLLLRPGGLTWVPKKDGSIVINTRAAAEDTLITATHRFDAAVDISSLREACMYSGRMEWADIHGDGGTIKTNGPKTFKINHTYAAHLQVARFLAPFRANGK